MGQQDERRKGQEEAGKEDEQQVEGPMREKDTLVHIFALISLNQLMNVLQLQTIWWLQVVAAVEMKRTDSQDRLAVIKQLFGLAPNLARAVRQKIRLRSHTRTRHDDRMAA